jgi:hypothetical protein
MKDILKENDIAVNTLELRNYLLKPGKTDAFIQYFNKHFVAPMEALGGHTLGQFIINGINNRFVWMRGFEDMETRLKFLNDFYVSSSEWKTFGPGANEMMINSDNVYLLRPLDNAGKPASKENNINTILKTGKRLAVVDFYTCNNSLGKVIELFNKDYLPFLANLGINDTTLWVSEMTENKFPRLPAFQDKNLLVTITTYTDFTEYQLKTEQLNLMPEELKTSILELVTTHQNLILHSCSPRTL